MSIKKETRPISNMHSKRSNCSSMRLSQQTQARTEPTTTPNATTNPVIDTFVISTAPLAVALAEAADPLAADVPEAAAGALAPVGTPSPVSLSVNGPGPVDAEAPTPTRPPSSCCCTKRERWRNGNEWDGWVEREGWWKRERTPGRP